MTNKELLGEASAVTITVTVEEQEAVNRICAEYPGWSGYGHYAFFRSLLGLPINSLLILGVYHGRDMALIAEVLRRYHPDRAFWTEGVDRFTADPCADWRPTNKPRTWEEETNGLPPPSFESALRVTDDYNGRHFFGLHKTDDFAFLETCGRKYDAIYLDTSHDFNTVSRQLRQVEKVANPGAVICGDDFSDQYTWGVKSAVEARFSSYLLFGGWIWAAFLEDKR